LLVNWSAIGLFVHFFSHSFSLRVDRKQVHGKSKMKKAFCEPGNIGFCPPIAIASEFAIGSLGGGTLSIRRSEENGGDKDYTSVQELESDYANGSLHPGDLKAATALLSIGFLEKLSAGYKADPAVLKATKDLKNFQKKLAKMKK